MSNVDAVKFAAVVSAAIYFAVLAGFWLDGELPWQTHMPSWLDFMGFVHRHATCRIKGHNHTPGAFAPVVCWRCGHLEDSDGA